MTDNELSALVAERVMGWKRSTLSIRQPADPMLETWVNNDGNVEAMTVAWRPASNIAAAWYLVEKEDKFILRSLEHKWDYWLVWYQRTIDDDAEYVTAPTAPRAICIAALKAVGVEVEAN